MSQAEELLNSLTDDQIAAYSADSDNELHVVIRPDRVIVVPEELKRIAVQYDHDVETVTFDCPRYWDEHDLDDMVIYINYMRSDKYTASYPVTQVWTGEDDYTIHFSWTISRNVTEVDGPISFLVCAKKTDAEGNETIHWNSELCQDMYISRGLETEEQPEETHPDIITELLLRMDNVEKVAVTKDRIDAALAETKAYTQGAATIYQNTLGVKNEVDASASEIRNSYANAIKKSKSGTIITANDVSPLEHDVKVKVTAKTINYCSVEPTRRLKSDFSDCYFLPKGTYTMSMNFVGATSWRFVITLYDLNGNLMTDATSNTAHLKGISLPLNYSSGNGGIYQNADNITVNYLTFETDADYYIGINFHFGNTTADTTVTEVQLEEGTVVTEYTPPNIDLTTVTVTGCGKNMFDDSKIAGLTGWQFSNGMYYGLPAYLHNAFGPNGGTPLVTRFKPMTQYTLSCDAYAEVTAERPVGGTFRFEYTDGSHENVNINTATKSKYTFVSADGKTLLNFRMSYGHNVMTYMGNIQLEEGTVATAYEPYSSSTATPAEDGTCTVKSVSPNMTIFANNPSVTIEAEYNQDIINALNDSQDTRPIYYTISDDCIRVTNKYNSTHRWCMELCKKGGNNLFDFYTGYLVEDGTGIGHAVYKNTTDFHSPFVMKAVNNIDGDTPSSWEFTGGNHAYNGDNTGTPTARTTSLEFWIDNRKISNGVGAFSGKANIIEIRWSNNVQANNTVKEDGSGREVLTEKHTLTFNGYEWDSHVELIPLEDVRVTTWYGLQCSLNSEKLSHNPSGTMYSGTYKFIGGANRQAIDLTVSDIPINNSGDNSTIGMMSEKDGHAVSMIIDPTYDLGKRTMYTGTRGVFFNKTTKKTYFYIIDGQLLSANCSYFLRGKYRFYSTEQ